MYAALEVPEIFIEDVNLKVPALMYTFRQSTRFHIEKNTIPHNDVVKENICAVYTTEYILSK